MLARPLSTVERGYKYTERGAKLAWVAGERGDHELAREPDTALVILQNGYTPLQEILARFPILKRANII